MNVPDCWMIMHRAPMSNLIQFSVSLISSLSDFLSVALVTGKIVFVLLNFSPSHTDLLSV